tara:strand:+ start:232 stop:474 length:243 start_codon:yes stop_codon:yes gene_type:complete
MKNLTFLNNQFSIDNKNNDQVELIKELQKDIRAKKVEDQKTQLSNKDLQLVINSLSMTIASIDTAENKVVYLELYDKLIK